MKAQSSVYVKLQGLYKSKARKDAQEVFETVKILPGGEHTEFAEVELFCKNARFVKLINASGSKRDIREVFGKSVALQSSHVEFVLTRHSQREVKG